MKSRITAIVSLLLLALLPSLMALDIQPKPPGPVITTGNANLRAKPSMSAEILVSLKKDAVLVARGESMDPKAPADEPREWVEVTAPAGAKVSKITDLAGSPVKGAATAKVTIVLWSDFQCPFCSRVEPTMKQILDTYGKDIRYVWKNQPLPFHNQAMPAAIARGFPLSVPAW